MPTSNATIIKTSASTAAPNTAIQIIVNESPNICPLCHVTIEPEFLTGTPLALAFDWVEAYYRCTNMRCRRQFTAFYKRDAGLSQNGMQAFRLQQCFPVAPVKPVFDRTIIDLSPNFVEIYGQSSAAENHGLAEVAGPGFRKALEFLVKDYAISLNPQDVEAIKQRPIAAVIKDFLSGEKLRVVSSRAAWLGNDQTHYQERWIGKDLQDLKQLIAATAHFIAMERLVADLPVDMPASGPAAPAAANSR
jgi:hypothetical protein